MKIITLDIKQNSLKYSIFIQQGLRRQIGQLLTEWYLGDKILIVTDSRVYSIYGEEIKEVLEDEGYQVFFYKLPRGEKTKSISYLEKGYHLLLEKGFNRNHLILALGGGVVGDLAGLMASTFMRGLSYIQVPTTLLAQVDSSVGGKTAINLPHGKNMVGTFYQPRAVYIDPNFLETLTVRQLKTGLAEVIKYSLIGNSFLLTLLLKKKQAIFNLNKEILEEVIFYSCQEKARLVQADEREKGKRVFLNFGHTIGHALESLTDYEVYTHGEAIAVGMVGATRLSWHLGLLKEDNLHLIEDLLVLYDLPTCITRDIEFEDLKNMILNDKKVRDNHVRWVILKALGEPVVKEDIPWSLVEMLLEGLKCKRLP